MEKYLQRTMDVAKIDKARYSFTQGNTLEISFETSREAIQFLEGLCTGRQLTSGDLRHDHHCPVHFYLGADD